MEQSFKQKRQKPVAWTKTSSWDQQHGIWAHLKTTAKMYCMLDMKDMSMLHLRNYMWKKRVEGCTPFILCIPSVKESTKSPLNSFRWCLNCAWLSLPLPSWYNTRHLHRGSSVTHAIRQSIHNSEDLLQALILKKPKMEMQNHTIAALMCRCKLYMETVYDTSGYIVAPSIKPMSCSSRRRSERSGRLGRNMVTERHRKTSYILLLALPCHSLSSLACHESWRHKSGQPHPTSPFKEELEKQRSNSSATSKPSCTQSGVPCVRPLKESLAAKVQLMKLMKQEFPLCQLVWIQNYLFVNLFVICLYCMYIICDAAALRLLRPFPFSSACLSWTDSAIRSARCAPTANFLWACSRDDSLGNGNTRQLSKFQTQSKSKYRITKLVLADSLSDPDFVFIPLCISQMLQYRKFGGICKLAECKLSKY